MKRNQAAPDPLERAPLAYENLDFLNSPDARSLRILAEYAEPMARFQQQRIEDTVVFFGSARFGSPGAVDPAMARFYDDARTLAGMVTRWAGALPGQRHRFVVTSGGGPGIMEAANRGAIEAGGRTIGLNIKLPHEQAPNPYITPELNFEFSYFFMRKFWFAYLAKALVVFPGGFGTLDELFEIVTLAQTHKLTKDIAIVIYGKDYWRRVLDLDYLVETGAVSRGDLALLQFADTPQDAFHLLRAGLEREVERSKPGPGRGGEHIASAQDVLGPDIAKTRV